MVMVLVMMKFFNIKLEALGKNIQNTVVQEAIINVALVSLSRLVGRVDHLPPQQQFAYLRLGILFLDLHHSV